MRAENRPESRLSRCYILTRGLRGKAVRKAAPPRVLVQGSLPESVSVTFPAHSDLPGPLGLPGHFRTVRDLTFNHSSAEGKVEVKILLAGQMSLMEGRMVWYLTQQSLDFRPRFKS